MPSKTNPSYQVVILAAGKGTRMRSPLPKVLHKVCGLTLLERTLRAVSAISPERIVVVVGYGKELVEEEIRLIQATARFSKIPIEAVEQKNQLGTGDAVRTSLAAIANSPKSRVLIVPGDSPLLSQQTIRDIIAADVAGASPELLVVSCDVNPPDGYGRIVREKDGSLKKIVEHKDCSEEELLIQEINASIYCSTVDFLTHSLAKIEPRNAQGEFYLPDIAAIGVAEKKRSFVCKMPDAIELLGANTRAELAALEGVARSRINRRIMEAGTTLEDPQSTYIDEDVVVGEDCFIGAGVRLKGKTTLGSGVVLEGESYIVDTFLGAGSVVKFGCHFESAKVGNVCKLGPYARLRPGAVLGNDVHIGNFVEVKKSEIGDGSKANHLTYIGDATIGKQVNVGAGTITCNYDGANKFQTVIEDGAFIGSNTSLVAPVKVGAKAITGAGSVITKEVPAGALAVERSAQVNREGYKRKTK